MRLVALLMLIFFSMAVTAEEPALVPPKKTTKKDDSEKEDDSKKEEKSEYQDLYQQYLNKYKQQNEKKEEPAPEVKKEEPAPSVPEPKKEVPALVKPEKKIDAAPKPFKDIPVAAENKKINKQIPIKKKAEKRDYTFHIKGFGAITNGMQFFGSDKKSSSYKFTLDNALVDMDMNINSIAKARFLYDFAALYSEEVSFVSNNYNTDLDAVEVDGGTGNKVDAVKEASIDFDNLPYGIIIKAGKFQVPFGIENSCQAYEIPFWFKSRVSEVYLGNGFNDLGATLGYKIDLFPGSTLTARYTMFNGSNSVQLDGADLYNAPAHSFDIRYEATGKLESTVSFSVIYGSAYMPFESISGGLAESIASKVKDVDTYDLRHEEKNLLFGAGVSLDYHFSDTFKLGFDGEFFYSSRSLYNPAVNYTSGTTGYLLVDSISLYTDTNYTSYGFYIAPKMSYSIVDLMLRFSMHKAPTFIETLGDDNNLYTGFDALANINFADNAGLALSFRYYREKLNHYLPLVDAADYSEETFNTTEVFASLWFSIDYFAK